MKKILCFGDSNVYGYIPGNHGRYDKESRWSGILKSVLKDKFEVIEEGCNNRTCFSNNPNSELVGIKAVKRCFNSQIDILILLIGINDLQTSYDNSIKDIERGIGFFVSSLKEISKDMKIILLIPPLLNKNINNNFFKNLFDKNSIENSKELPKIYKNIAKRYSCECLDLNKLVTVSELDGLHLDLESHRKIGHFLVKYIQENFKY